MTDRINYLTVALEENVRIDDVQPLIKAIETLRGVLKAEPHVADPSAWTAEQRARSKLGRKLLQILYPTE